MFPDNTVLINFAIISRMDLLARLANGNGQWCATVAIECAESAKRPDLAALGGAGEIFGQPLFPDQAELQDIHVLRDQLASPGDRPTQHLGEAETIAIIARRHLSCFFVSDDRGAARLAAQNGIAVVGTWHLLKVAHRKGWIDADTFWGYVLTLEGHSRERRQACGIARPSTSGGQRDALRRIWSALGPQVGALNCTYIFSCPGGGDPAGLGQDREPWFPSLAALRRPLQGVGAAGRAAGQRTSRTAC
jgi:predicted nucleic acid-binding protein